ncbi:MAG: hypothetical protein HQK76_14650 [Desulfobacterales bacterium]|nr:hypothetical protein [Desulfobacterales bacterium]
MKLTSKIFVVFLIVITNFIFFSCASIKTSKIPDEAALRNNITIVWDAKLNNDFGKIYDLTTDAYKQKVSKDKFGSSNVKINKYNISKIELLDEGKKAKVFVDFTVNQMGNDFPFSLNEDWIVENGSWKLDIQPSAGGKPLLN